jgi:hypothetical protein
MSQLRVAVTCRSYVLQLRVAVMTRLRVKLHVAVTCRSYDPVTCKVTCRSYVSPLRVAVTCPILIRIFLSTISQKQIHAKIAAASIYVNVFWSIVGGLEAFLMIFSADDVSSWPRRKWLSLER